MTPHEHLPRYDLLVIGSGPAGQKAAIQASKGGLAVAVCEQQKSVGGACVHYGTIPSKALRERALQHRGRHGDSAALPLDQDVPVADLIGEVDHIVEAHDTYMAAQLARNNVTLLHGRARFETPTAVRLRRIDGSEPRIEAAAFVIATGSVPRTVPGIPVDHEFIYDSDSILSLPYLPRTLAVLGGGVIACEYASIFALLGVSVTLIDRAPRPLGFLEPMLAERFLESFRNLGGTFLGNATVASVEFDGLAGTVIDLDSGTRIRTDKVLCALGRVAQIGGLCVERAGVTVSERGVIPVNQHGQTNVPHIYAAGDVIGAPSLASASMEQGRRAAQHLLGADSGHSSGFIPTGIYAIPELASVGLTAAEARAQHAGVVIGEARFSEIAKGQINGTQAGYLELVVSGDRRIRGVHIAGDQATELVHMGQMALIHAACVDVFIENVFNFPTYGESFRVAALNAARKLG